MKVTFLVPPCYDHKQPAERSAGCTRVVYLAPNIYELTVIAAVRELKDVETGYLDCVGRKISIDRFEQLIAADTSDAYLIWAVNLSIESDLQALAAIRRAHPSTPVVFMGPGPTYFTSKCLVDERVYVVRGEPDLTVVELIEALHDGKPIDDIDGLSYLKNGHQVNNKPRPLIADLDALPFPARDVTAGVDYHNPKLKVGPYTTMFTSRNCPFRCIYCVPSSLSFAREIEYRKEHGRKPTIGFRSIESVEAEVAMLHEAGYKAIGFMDDNFIWNEERTAALCKIMKKYDMVWGCEARVDAVTEPIARMLGESNCRYVDLGVESFDDEILKYIKKGITVSDIYQAINLLAKYDVPVKLNILIGSCPLETRQTVKHTLSEAKKLPVDQVMFNIVSPFPGTEYYELCKENGWIKGGDYEPTDVQRNSILDLPQLSAKEMERLLFFNNLSFFLSPKFIARQLRRFTSWQEFTHAAKALKIKLFG
ncbi:MAG: radical SAM protein [Muribaculaceae bacterium]|nr:radical SAM protein [Muribaculaceae bacterium]